MKIRPLNDKVLVLRMEQEQETASGIIIPDTAMDKSQIGRIIAAGPGKTGDKGERIPMEVKEGDRILLSKYAGTEIEIYGIEHIFMKPSDILAVFDDD